MPYEGICDGETKGPRQVHEDATVHCPECDREMHVVKSFERTDGAFVSRHYRHNRRDGAGGGGAGGASCGESDAHIKYKSIAASQLENIFAENCWKCEMEYRLLDTATDADHRDADALLLFDERDEQLGQGIAAEVQYKNKTKDKRAVERDYIENDIATLWLEPDDFGDHRMRLSEADIRHRAREAVWPSHTPKRAEWWTNAYRPRTLAFTNDDFNPHDRDVSVPATLPEPVVDTIRYEESDWNALFHDHPADHFRAQAAVPRSPTRPATRARVELAWTRRSQAEFWKQTPWKRRFSAPPTDAYIRQVAATGNTTLVFGAVLPLDYVTDQSLGAVDAAVEPPNTPHNDVQCHKCGKYRYAPTAPLKCENCGTPYDWDWNIETGRITADSAPVKD